MEALAAPLFLVLPCVAVAAALHDVATYKIPNWMSAVLLAAYAPTALAAGMDAQSVALGALIGLAALLVGMALFALNWLGGGDAKIMAAIVPFMGLAALPQFLLFTALAGGALSLGLMAARGFAPSLPVGPVWIGRLMDARGPLPYGVAICVGALAAYPASTIGQAAFGG